MILGILSDTHGRRDMAIEAMKVLRANGAVFFIHCGDVGDGVLDLLPRGQAAFVFGNNDYDHLGIAEEADALGIRCMHTGGIVTLAGKSIAVTHGDDARKLNAYVGSGTIDYVLSGHTHQPHDLRTGTTRRINPGALHRAARKTVATLDLSCDVLTLLSVYER